MMISELKDLLEDPQDYILANDLNGSNTFTKSQLLMDVDKLRGYLKGTSQKRWLLTHEHPYLFTVGFLALVCLDQTVVLSANRKSSWLTEIEPSFDAILGDEITSASCNKQIVSIGFSQLATLARSEQLPIQISGKESVVFFTSGSTGKAKEVVKSLSYLLDEVATLERAFGTQLARSPTVSSVSHFHIYGLLFNLLWPLLSRRLWLTEVVEFQEQLVGVSQHINHFAFISSPAFLSRLDSSMQIAQAEMVFSSGGPLSYESASKVHNVFASLPIEVYGSTETGGIGYRSQAHRNQAWQLFEQVYLSTESGETYLMSPHIGRGVQVKLDDNIQILSEQSFALAGRSDRVVKIEEKRISLTEIEDYLNSLASIKECACIVLQNKRTIIGAVLVLTQTGVAELHQKGRYAFFQSLKLTMRTRFENVTIPRKWRTLEELPVNQQSKREYSELKRLFESES